MKKKLRFISVLTMVMLIAGGLTFPASAAIAFQAQAGNTPL